MKNRTKYTLFVPSAAEIFNERRSKKASCVVLQLFESRKKTLQLQLVDLHDLVELRDFEHFANVV